MLSCVARLHMLVLCCLVTYADIVLLGYNAGHRTSDVRTMVRHTSDSSEGFVTSSLETNYVTTVNKRSANQKSAIDDIR